MVSLAQRRRDRSYLVAALEIMIIVIVSALWAHFSGQPVLIIAALSSSVVVGGMLWVQWHRTKRGAAGTFQPEMMPAIVAALVVTRAFSAALPPTLPGIAALALELMCALNVGGAFALLFSVPTIRKAATGFVRLLR